ncbi:protein of unknown function [Aminobacter niigataensis]|nr:protein of unknown function [Aminobacter niigataensis]
MSTAGEARRDCVGSAPEVRPDCRFRCRGHWYSTALSSLTLRSFDITVNISFQPLCNSVRKSHLLHAAANRLIRSGENTHNLPLTNCYICIYFQIF